MIVPHEWCHVARRHNGVIAGGCLRDLILGRPIGDVDIFKGGLLEGDERYVEGMHRHILKEKGVTYDIVTHRWGRYEFLDQFDVGLCKVAYDPRKDQWIYTDDFVHDLANRTLTIVNGSQLTTRHLAKVQAKYPDFKLVRELDDELPF